MSLISRIHSENAPTYLDMSDLEYRSLQHCNGADSFPMHLSPGGTITAGLQTFVIPA